MTRANDIATMIKDGRFIDYNRIPALVVEEYPTITGGIDSATLSDAYDINRIEVHLNGVLLKKTTEYTLQDSAIILQGGEVFADSDVLAITVFKPDANSVNTELATASDVNISNIADGELLKYDSATSKIIPTSLIEDGNGNVGIGTSFPAVPLNVTGQIRTSSDTTHYGTLNGLSGGLYISHRNDTNDGAILLGGGGGGTFTERMRIAPDGNVGIGNSSPSTTLDVTGDITASRLFINDSTGDTALEIDRDINDPTTSDQRGQLIHTSITGASDNSGNKFAYGLENLVTNSVTGYDLVSGNRSYTYGNYTYSEQSTGSTSGYNYGTYSYAAERSGSSGTASLNYGMQGLAIAFDGTSLDNNKAVVGFAEVREQSTATNCIAVDGETQINSSGGTITTAYGGYFTVDLNTPNPGVSNTIGTAYGVRSYINNRTSSSITNATYLFRGQAAGSGSYGSTIYGVHVSGEGHNRGDVGWTVGSDIRIKENVENITDAVDKVKQIRGVTYNRIGKDLREAGVIAQELEEVLPEAVVDFEPDPDDDDDRILKGVTYDRITALLIEAIKEQQTTIEALETRLTALEGGA